MAPVSLSAACLPISRREAGWVASAAPAVGTQGGSGAGPLAGRLVSSFACVMAPATPCGI